MCLQPEYISMEIGRTRSSSSAKEGDHQIAITATNSKVHPLDAGALFVLESKGTWVHAGFHLTTSIVTPALLTLPFAFTSLGWVAGMICLTVSAAVTFYAYNLLSMVLEHLELQGNRQLRFRDLTNHVMGPKWGRFLVGPIQFLVCYGAVIGCTLVGGLTLKNIYSIYHPDGPMKLYQFIICFGGLMLLLAQIQSFHSLRHINLVSLALCLAYSACAAVGSVYAGHSDSMDGYEKDYSVVGSTTTKFFGALNAFSIIATNFGNGIIPEIQATLAPPVSGKMFKGFCVCYAVVISAFYFVAISGYWAFGNKAGASILSNFHPPGRPALLPRWFLFMSNMFILLQISTVAVVYAQPTFEVLESQSADVNKGKYSMRNFAPRLILRTVAVVIATVLAAMLPFFGDVTAVLGAFGFLPLDFVLPLIMYNITFKPSQKSVIFWTNVTIAVVFSIMSLLGCIAAVRQFWLHAHTYKLFADV